jgi:hypothetical protein
MKYDCRESEDWDPETSTIDWFRNAGDESDCEFNP